MTNHTPAKQTKEPPESHESFKEKFQASFQRLKSNEKLEQTFSYATANTRDTISYVILIIGIVLLFFHDIYGGALIGLIAGFYFSSEILALFHNSNAFIEEQGIVKSLIGGGLLLALFISAPAIFVGIALAVAVRQILFPEAPLKK